jgi:hypothetical protein
MVMASPLANAKSLHKDYQLLRGEVQQYGDWLVGCDNNAECTMIGFPQPMQAVDGDVPDIADMSIRISFSGKAGAPPVVEIRPVTELEEACASVKHISYRFKLSANGRQSQAFYGYTPATLVEAEAHFLLNAYEKKLKVAGVDPETGRVAIRFPVDQSKQAFVAMQKRRAQLLRELEDKAIDELPGELPDGSTMPVPGKHRRIAAMSHILSGFIPVQTDKNCGASKAIFMGHYRFANGALLWSYACEGPSYPERTYWEMAHQPDAMAVPLSLPDPMAFSVHAGSNGLQNAVFDWDFGILREYAYLKGGQSCGTFRAWGYTDNGWQLLERREMPLCRGIQSSDWIRTHYTPTDGPGPDE